MNKLVLLTCKAKEYLSSKHSDRRQRKFISLAKFSVVFLILMVAVWSYAYVVTTASTMWYFLEQEKNKLEDAEFNKSIQKLEIITSEKRLRDEMRLTHNYSRYEWHGKNMVTVNAYDEEYVYVE